MDDIKILEGVERYIRGEMSPDERVYFEQLRKTSPDIDQMVVEHTFFLQQMNRYDQTRQFKTIITDTHTHLTEKGEIKSAKLQGKSKVIYLFNRYKRTASIAASIAGITALIISALVLSVTPDKPNEELRKLGREINALKNQNQQQNKEINKVKQAIGAPTIIYKTGGTGFLISTKGLLVTNAHIIQNAKNIVVQNTQGQDYSVKVVFVDSARDIAILKINDTSFTAPASIPYSIRKTSADIAEPIYTLGFPRNDIVYGEGYMAASTGYNGDTLTCQIAIAANPGNSGGPIINRDGEVVGVLSAKQTSAEGVVFATQAKYIYMAMNSLQEDSLYNKIKIPGTSLLKGVNRMQQVKKIADYIYMVKVS